MSGGSAALSFSAFGGKRRTRRNKKDEKKGGSCGVPKLMGGKSRRRGRGKNCKKDDKRKKCILKM